MSVVALPIPPHHRSVDDVLATAKRLDLGNIVVLSEMEDGSMVFLHGPDLRTPEVLWLLECGKRLLMTDYVLSEHRPKEIG